jgi:hypothetical protein
MGCSPCEACRVESEMRQLVGGPSFVFYPPSSLESWPRAMETMAKTSAAEVLPLELERLGSEGQRELAVRYDTSPDELVGVLTDRHIDGLLNPIGTAIPKLQVTTPASEGRIIADLYWRCCIAMQMSAPCESNRTSLPACSPCTPIGTPVGTRRAS